MEYLVTVKKNEETILFDNEKISKIYCEVGKQKQGENNLYSVKKRRDKNIYLYLLT